MLSLLSISQRLYALIALFAIGLLALTAYTLNDLHSNLMDAKRQEIRSQVDTALSVLAHYQQLETDGQLSKDDAQAQALSIITALRYNGSEYFWVNNRQNVMVAHGVSKKILGRPLDDLEDAAGTRIFEVMNKMIDSAGKGYLSYLWPRAGSEEPVAKESYVQLFKPWQLVVGTGLYVDDVTTAFNKQAVLVVALAAIALLIVVALSLLIARSIRGPLNGLSTCMYALAKGDLSVDVPGQNDRHELGAMSKAVMVFKETAGEQQRLQQEKLEAESRNKEANKQAMNDLAGQFEATVKGVVESVNHASRDMQGTAQSMTGFVQDATTKANAVAHASTEASHNVQTVSAAAEELTSSIQEIGRQVSNSTDVSQSALKGAEQANVLVEGLVASSEKIGEVVTLIQDIAEQTNLLALNATIEAARAGEAGKGFAVVASEVKSLANQTAKATEEISSQISDIQSSTGNAAEAIRNIGKTVSEINEIASSISAAVEQQGAATQEIARNVGQASEGTSSVSSNISGVSHAISESDEAAGKVLSASQDLSQQSEMLKVEVESFIEKIRAA
ncbi:methyl-accepting chemotaxis protein [Rhodovibrionaceae bacterium A322]